MISYQSNDHGASLVCDASKMLAKRSAPLEFCGCDGRYGSSSSSSTQLENCWNGFGRDRSWFGAVSTTFSGHSLVRLHWSGLSYVCIGMYSNNANIFQLHFSGCRFRLFAWGFVSIRSRFFGRGLRLSSTSLIMFMMMKTSKCVQLNNIRSCEVTGTVCRCRQ